MNFVEHYDKLKKLMYTQGGKPFSGNYIYSRDKDDDVYKMGMSQAGLFKRVASAKSCYPFQNEFHLHYLIISLDGQYTKGEKSTTRQIEDDLLTTSKAMSTVELQKHKKKEEGRRPREYRIVSTKAKLYTLLKDTLNKHRDKWDYLVIFSEKGWHIVANNRVVPVPITNINQLKRKPNSYEGRPDVESLPLNKTHLVLKKGLKVGDTVTGTNWAPFVVEEIISKKRVVGKFKGDSKLYDIIV
jgi:hypothetical protein